MRSARSNGASPFPVADGSHRSLTSLRRGHVKWRHACNIRRRVSYARLWAAGCSRPRRVRRRALLAKPSPKACALLPARPRINSGNSKITSVTASIPSTISMFGFTRLMRSNQDTSQWHLCFRRPNIVEKYAQSCIRCYGLLGHFWPLQAAANSTQSRDIAGRRD